MMTYDTHDILYDTVHMILYTQHTYIYNTTIIYNLQFLQCHPGVRGYGIFFFFISTSLYVRYDNYYHTV